MRKPAIIKGNDMLCGNCKVKLLPQVDTQDDDEWCWSCPKCDEWFTVGGDPAFHGTSVPESSAPAAE